MRDERKREIAIERESSDDKQRMLRKKWDAFIVNVNNHLFVSVIYFLPDRTLLKQFQMEIFFNLMIDVFLIFLFSTIRKCSYYRNLEFWRSSYASW